MVECKNIDELYEIIKEEIAVEIKARIDESLSSKLYHFCPLAAAVNILKDGRFHLSSVDRHSTEKDIASVISSREKAIYPYSKVVNFRNELPQKEKDGIIYKVKKGDENTPDNACFRFNNGQWEYIPNSENLSRHIGPMRTGKVTQTELPDGRISYANDSGRLKGQYYMCFSRTPGAFDGYSGRMSGKKWKGAYVRFSINGDILNQRYKGGPVNFYTNSDRIPDSLRNLPLNVVSGKGATFVSKPMITTKANGEKFANEIDRVKAYEHEDRVFSNDQFIPSKTIRAKDGQIVKNTANIFSSGIVTRVDIFVLKSILMGDDEESQKVINEIGYILKKCKLYGFLKNTHIYNTEKGLSLLPIQTIYDESSPYMKKKYAKIFGDYMEIEKSSLLTNNAGVETSGKIKKEINDSDAELIAEVIGYLAFGNVDNDKKYLSAAKKMMSAYGFMPYYKQVVEKLKPLSYYSDTIQKADWFSFEFKLIKANINQLQGWKIPKIADNLRKMITEYQIRCNLPKIGSIVTQKKRQWEAAKKKNQQKFDFSGAGKRIINKAVGFLYENEEYIIDSVKDDIMNLCNEYGINFKAALKKISLNWITVINKFFEDVLDMEDRYGNTDDFIENLKSNPNISGYISTDSGLKDALLFAIECTIK